MRIGVIGGGHGCYAAAADLVEKGHRVRPVSYTHLRAHET